jgi:histone acetyltransferase (RNA polymerase elongator complex component)
MLQLEMKRNGLVCNCIRCREVGLNSWSNQGTSGAGLVIRKYNASGADEYFLSYESSDERLLYGFVRLRLSRTAGAEGTFPVLEGAALVRELHVYGQLIPTYYEGGSKSSGATHQGGKVQHAGFGSKLMRRAEEIAKERGFARIAVIAGVGTREYYRKIGYTFVEESGGFLVKNLVPKAWDFAAQFVAVAGVAVCLVAVLRDSAAWGNPMMLWG